MTKSDVVRRAWEELEPHLGELGYELVEVEFGQHGHQRILCLYIDKEGGITVDDCARASHVLDPVLDALDFVGGNYVLEVSSPGIDRPVRKASDFARFVGEKLKLRTHAPVQGRSRFTGVLAGFGDGLIQMDCGGTAYEIHIENVLKAKLDR